MRFIWLALSLLGPVFTSHVYEAARSTLLQNTYLYVGLAFLVICIGITVAEFVKHRNKERHVENRLLLQERDGDIAKWRKAFFEEAADLYDAQKVMLTKAHELGEHQANIGRKSNSGSSVSG